jgi:putative nucleotidyltransferase with HDIG domain
MRPFADVIRRIEAIICDVLADWPDGWIRFTWPGYTYEHTLRVRNLALALGDQLGANHQVVHLAALLHDIGKPAGEPHAVPSAERAETVMRDLGIDLLTIERACYAIANHITQSPLHPVENLALYDADLIDANFGLVAFLRYISIRANRGSTVQETIEEGREWVLRVDSRRQGLLTDAGREIAAIRYARMLDLHAQLDRELAAGGGPAMRMAAYVNGDAQRPSLTRQVSELAASAEDPEFRQQLARMLAQEIAAEV